MQKSTQAVKKISFIGDEKFRFGIEELSSQLGYTLAEDGYPIYAVKTEEKELTVITEKDKATVYYPENNCFFKGFSFAVQFSGQENTVKVKRLFGEIGTMQNCSESVLTVGSLKEFIRQSALMGYTYIGVYTEATYTVEDEPYFGYKGGAYSTEELKEIVSYGEKFFVEAIPYIQTLSHLNQLFRWPQYGEIKDVEDIMLVDYDKSYELIEKMIASLRKAYTTDKINLGMDEAYRIGTGRYRWFINEESVDTAELFIRHLKKVIAIAEKYGFTTPEIWFDNLFGMKFKGYIFPPEWLFKDLDARIRAEFPEIKLNLWYYGIETQKEMKRLIKNVRQLSKELSFSTIIHGYSSYAPLNSFAERAADFVKEACLNNGIDDILITSWGMVSPFANTAGYLRFMESFSKSSGYNAEERAVFLFGNTYTELMQLDLPNEVDFEVKKPSMYEYNPPVYIMAEDPLLGIMQNHIPNGAKAEYIKIAETLEKAEKKGGRYSYLFGYEKKMCLALAEKAPLSSSIKTAYDRGDKKALKSIAEQISVAIEKIGEFHREYRKTWLKNFKSFGLELFDMRFGGVVARLQFISETLLDYANGKIDEIEELKEVRLPYSKGAEGKITCNANWDKIAIGRNMRL